VKYTNLRAFEKHLESSAPNLFSHVYLISAKEAFDRKTAADRTHFHLLKGIKNSEMCLKHMDGESLSLDELFGELSSISFFAERLVVIVQNADKLKKNITVALEGYMAKPNSSTYLILVTPGLTSTTNFYKKIEKEGIILDVAQEKPWEKEKNLTEWVASFISATGKTIAPNMCQLLVKQIGTDQTLLQNEIEKILCYIGERPSITAQDISAICTSVNIETVWQLGEAIFQRDAPQALKIGKTLIRDGTPLLALLKQVRSQFQTEYQICCILAGGGTSRDVSAQFPYMKGFILEKHVQAAQAYGLKRFKIGLLSLDETEVKAKNSGADPELLAELLLLKLTG